MSTPQTPSPRSRALGPRRRTLMTAALAGLTGLGAAACSDASAGGGAASDGGGAGGEGRTDYPLQITNCEASVTIDAAPTRVVLLESAPVTVLEGIGVLDRVVAKAGSFPSAYYDADLARRVEAIDVLSDDLDATGHLQISQEVVISCSPDLVLGMPDGITRDGLADAGAQVLVQNVYCGSGGDASFDDLFDEARLYGRVFDRQQAAEDLVASLTSRLDALEEQVREHGRASAAVLYPSLGGGPLYTYGAKSMATPQLEAAGLDNCFSHVDDRVFEVEAEALIDADPEWLIVLHQGEGDGSGLVDQVAGAAGMDAVRAVRDGRILPLLFNFTEPATPLVVDGAERIAAWRIGDVDGGASDAGASDAGASDAEASDGGAP
jgi:iron complex transport system substrate-binding protein